MKLWVKISVICTAILLLIVVLFSALLLVQAKDNMLNMAMDYAKAKQHDLQTSFSEMVNYYLEEDVGNTVEYSLVDYCFKRFADHESVLVKDGKAIYSQVSVLPEELLPISDDEQQTLLSQIYGRNILIVGNSTHVRTQEYWVYTVQDITPVYDSIAQMVWRFVLIAFISILLGTALIILLVRKSTQPLVRLGGTTKQIAGGDYTQRATVLSQDEVGRLAQDFNQMADAVETHVAQLTETATRQELFIGGVTHEFKTPMTSLLIHSETLMSTNLTQEEVQRSLIHIHTQVQWLERLTQKLLKLITLHEQPERNMTSVSKLFEAVEESMQESLHQQKIALYVQCDMEALYMDEDLMHSLLVNLLDNAAKASRHGQEIRLLAYDNTIEVSDDGAGIPQEEIERVTEPFYMVDRSRSKLKGGSGLGLALVKAIVDAHDAKIVIQSVLNKGTAIQIIFPDNISLTF